MPDGADVLKQVLKGLARALCGDYSVYRIYRLALQPSAANADLFVQEIGADALAALANRELAALASYAGQDCTAFCLRLDGAPAAVCFYWSGDRYRDRSRGFWPLAPGQAKLVQIVTAPSARGRGVATRLIAESARRMSAAGWQVLYARVWHSHSASWRAFERAGWQRVALVLEVNPLRLARPWRLRLAIRSRS